MNTEPNKEGVGAFIGSIIIVTILLVGAVYFFHSEIIRKQEEAKKEEQIKAENLRQAAILEAIENQLSQPEPDYIQELNKSATSTK